MHWNRFSTLISISVLVSEFYIQSDIPSIRQSHIYNRYSNRGKCVVLFVFLSSGSEDMSGIPSPQSCFSISYGKIMIHAKISTHRCPLWHRYCKLLALGGTNNLLNSHILVHMKLLILSSPPFYRWKFLNSISTDLWYFVNTFLGNTY